MPSKSKKVALKPNHGYINWLNLCARSQDLSSFCTNPKPSMVNLNELAKHNKISDCWLAIAGFIRLYHYNLGKVYNLTPYMDYHPGGPSTLLDGSGKDATKLFYEAHSYVNYQKMLAKCYIAPLAMSISDSSYKDIDSLDDYKPEQNNLLSTLSINSYNLKSASFSINPLNAIDNYDASINQTSSKFILFCGVEKSRRKYSLSPKMDSIALTIKSSKYIIKIQKGFVAKYDLKCLYFLSYFNDLRYILHLEFTKQMKSYFKVKWLNMDIGVLEIDVFYKLDSENDTLSLIDEMNDTSNRSNIINLRNEGTLPLTCNPLLNNDRAYDPHDYIAHMQYHECKLAEKRQITPDVYLFKFSLPLGTSMKCPIGYHNLLRLGPDSSDLAKPYTPIPNYLVLPRGSIYSPAADIVPNYNNSLNYVIKIYPNGKFTPALHRDITIGKRVWISDFIGDFDESRLFTTCQQTPVEDKAGQTDLPPSIIIEKTDDYDDVKVGTRNNNNIVLNIRPIADDKYLLLITGGTGIAPILGILHRLYNDDLYLLNQDKLAANPISFTTPTTSKRRSSITNRRESSAFNFSKSDFEKIMLVDCNRTPQDIIWNKELNELHLKWPYKFIYLNVISKLSKNYDGPVDYISGHMNQYVMTSQVLPRFFGEENEFLPKQQQHQPKKSPSSLLQLGTLMKNLDTSSSIFDTSHFDTSKLENVFTCVCGSALFNNSILNTLKTIGFNQDKIYVFSE